MAAALVHVINAGSALGLVDGHCPLCDAAQSEESFRPGVMAARERLSLQRSALSGLERRLQALNESCADMKHRDRNLLTLIEDTQGSLVRSRAKINALNAEASKLGFEFPGVTSIIGVREIVDKNADQLAIAEQALRLLLLAQSSSAISDSEEHLDALRGQLAGAEKRRARAIRATQSARDIDDLVRRTAHEVIEDRLSSISPLLSELFGRLRPHANWKQIHYRLRGDVRRFLSLTVGDNLNPQYVFSSGQRRAAGIAFLLAVYLSRTWAHWQTLVLDDPVQHIDDYRALNLVELLASMRRDDRQIICAVEDQALADLLARRLRSSPDSPGVRFDFATDADGSPIISRGPEIEQMTSNAFTGATSLPPEAANG